MKSAVDQIKAYKFYRYKPYLHQLGALRRSLEIDKGVALLMKPGTGKTRVVIDFCGIKFEQDHLRKVLVTCPKTACGVWEDEVENWLPPRIPRRVIVIDDEDFMVKEKADLLINGLRDDPDKLVFLVVYYEIIHHDKIKKALKKWKPQLIAGDEIHWCGHNSKRTRTMLSLGPTAWWRFGMTGSLRGNSNLRIFYPYKFIDSDVFGTNYSYFKQDYFYWVDKGGYQKPIKDRNTDILEQKMHSISFVATKADLDLPPSTPVPIKIKPRSATIKAYNEMEQEMYLWMEEHEAEATARIALTKLLRLSQITGGFIRDTNREDRPIIGGGEKLEALKELLEEYVLEYGEKVVIFARFKWEIRAIYQLCRKLKLGVLVNNGTKEVRRQFRDDPRKMVYITQIASGGISVNELVVSHIGIFYSVDDSYDHLEQAMGRLERSGQTEPVLFLFLLLKGTIDIGKYNTLMEHKSIGDDLVENGWRRYLSDNS